MVSLGGFDRRAGGPKSVDRWRLSFSNPMLSEGAAKARDGGERATCTRRSEGVTEFRAPLMRGRPGQDSFLWGGQCAFQGFEIPQVLGSRPTNGPSQGGLPPPFFEGLRETGPCEACHAHLELR